MATCACGTKLPGRAQKCEACKGENRTGAAVKKPRNTKTPRAKKQPTRKPPAKKAPAKKAARAKVTYPAGLGSRGRQLWKALGHDIDTPGGQLALEACRITDRLERLDSLLAGGDWIDLVEDEKRPGRIVVVVDKALDQARQQQLALRQLLNELGATRVKGAGAYGAETGKPAGPTPSTTPAADTPPTPLDAVRERRRRREQEA